MATHRYADGYRALKDIDPARMVAYTVLEQVNEEGTYANLILPKALR